jgi:predicted dehydrogenase
MSLVKDPNNIRLAMLGMVDGNGHPYSWSAIINGAFEDKLIRETPYPGIADYLTTAPKGQLGLPGVKVTHVWCDDPKDAEHVSRASHVPNVARRAEDVIGHVDAVVIATDKGFEHVDRCRPFIEARLPMFVDKPMVDRADHLQQFIDWHRAGHPILSTSGLRYSREFAELRTRLNEVGDLRLITMTMAKSWERYGIHALESVYPFLEPGQWQSVANTGTIDHNIVHVRHASGVEVVLSVIKDLYGGFGNLNCYGNKSAIGAKFSDTFFAFRAQLAAFVEYLRTGKPPLPFEQTVELMKIIIAGIRSREENGRRIELAEIRVN